MAAARRRSTGSTAAEPAKQEARELVWQRLAEDGAARFPFPPTGRIPNFAGAERAARRLLDEAPWCDARVLKVNPDAPQRPLRRLALERGISLLMATPRLRAGFLLFDPARIPSGSRAEAASLSKGAGHGRPVPLRSLPEIDAIVVGSVAVTRGGRRCGKGHGYADLEYAILRELGHPPRPVATTIHPLQWVEALPRDPTDLPVRLVCTPEETHPVARPEPEPEGLDWSRLGEAALREMPVLAELRRDG